LGYNIVISSYETEKDPKALRGLPGKLVKISTVDITQGSDDAGPYTEITVPDHFPPGSFMLFETNLQGLNPDLDAICVSGVEAAFGDLDLVDLNIVLYRCDGEERDATKGESGTYEIPGLSKLVYSGLEGWMHPLRHIIRHNDLGHPLCANLRNGIWALDYVHDRLFKWVLVSLGSCDSRTNVLIFIGMRKFSPV
jgi:glycogen debranching enzyme